MSGSVAKSSNTVTQSREQATRTEALVETDGFLRPARVSDKQS